MAKVGDGQSIFTRICIVKSPVIIGIGILWIKKDGLVEVRDGPSIFILFIIGISSQVKDLGMFWI